MTHRAYLLRSWLAVFAVAAACGTGTDDGATCETDAHCQQICSPIGECVSASSAIDIRVRWTVNGQAPTVQMPSICGDIADFEVQFESRSPRDPLIGYYPVPCENGTVFYPNMPDRLVSVRLIARDSSDRDLQQMAQSISASGTEVTFNFRR